MGPERAFSKAPYFRPAEKPAENREARTSLTADVRASYGGGVESL